MTAVVDKISESTRLNSRIFLCTHAKLCNVTSVKAHGKDSILPVFITCDPARDDVKAIKAYCSDFHPTLVGLTGTYEDIKKTCKTYRVYFSTPPDAKATDDYLVDHSIL
jgi:protein SCO1/2